MIGEHANLDEINCDFFKEYLVRKYVDMQYSAYL